MDNQWDLGYVITIVTMQCIYTMHHYHHLWTIWPCTWWTIWPCTWSHWVWNVWHALLNRSMISNPLFSMTISSPNCGVSSKGLLIWRGKLGKMALQVSRVLIFSVSRESMTIMTIAPGKLDEWCMGWFAMAIRKLTPNQTNQGWINFARNTLDGRNTAPPWMVQNLYPLVI